MEPDPGILRLHWARRGGRAAYVLGPATLYSDRPARRGAAPAARTPTTDTLKMLILAHTAGIQRSADRPEQHECSTTSAARVLHDDIDGTHAHLRSDYVRVLYSNLSYSNPAYLSAAASAGANVVANSRLY